MGVFEQEKGAGPGTGAKAKPNDGTLEKKPDKLELLLSNGDYNGYMQEATHQATVSWAKKLRDELDTKVPNLFKLSDDERYKVGMKVHLETMMLGFQDSLRPALANPDKTVSDSPIRKALDGLRPFFLVDPAKLNAGQKKKVLDAAQEQWKLARAELDKIVGPDAEPKQGQKPVIAPGTPPHKPAPTQPKK